MSSGQAGTLRQVQLLAGSERMSQPDGVFTALGGKGHDKSDTPTM